MMAPSDELFVLIKGLTQSEKRYFKVWASKHVVGKSNHYEKLFDALDTLPDDQPYDEAAFKKSLRGKSYGKNLRDEKNHLKEILLKSMRVYHAERTIEGRLSEMMQEIRFLYSKGMLDSCRSLLDRAYRAAGEHDHVETMLHVIKFMKLTDMAAYDEERMTKNAALQQQETMLIRMMELERRAYYLRERLYYLYYGRQMDGKKEEVNSIYKQLEEMEGEDKISFLTLQYIINSKAAILEHKKQYPEAAALYQKLIAAMEKQEWRIKEKPERFGYVISNCLTQIWRAEKFEDMPPLLEKIKNIQTPEPKVRANILVQYWQLSMIYFINTEKFREAYLLLPELQKGLKEYKSKLQFPVKINLINNICIVYLKNADYKGLLRSINDIYDLIDKRPEYNHRLREIKYLEFIAHFETGGIDILDNMIRNSQRFFRENNMQSEYSDLLWRLLRLLISCESGRLNATRTEVRKQLSAAACPAEYHSIHGLITAWV